MKKNKHVNIPIFIPHMGCPNMCVFCNQRSISGRNRFECEGVRREIITALSTIPKDYTVEIAYFGGSFTGIDRADMIHLLGIAQSFIDNPDANSARVCGIRMSTRPDYISPEIMKILHNYSVKTIELGLQSMDDEVLRLCRRGHTSKDAENACSLVKENGYELIGQMMIGLPGANIENEIMTAEKICDMHADGARIYPTVVFYDTELAEMTKRDEYKMLDTEEAVRRSCAALEIFDDRGVECIRIGLCASDNLSDEEKVMGGANHPAIGELVKGELYFNRLCELLNSVFNGADHSPDSICINIPKGHMSLAVGQHGRNRERIKQLYGIKSLKFQEKDVVTPCIEHGEIS